MDMQSFRVLDASACGVIRRLSLVALPRPVARKVKWSSVARTDWMPGKGPWTRSGLGAGGLVPAVVVDSGGSG